jgi:RNA polymerase sigma factor (TIGR02999 family)
MIGADRAQFFAVAAQAMRRILIDYARRHRALRRGGARQRVSLEMLDSTGADVLQAPQLVATDRAEELLALDEALERLATVHDRLCRVVELRFFAGLTEAETAEVLGVTSRTVTRDWVKARAWLFRALQDGHSNVT